MIDLVVRTLAGLLLCAGFAAIILSLPTVIGHVRAWVGQVRQGELPAPVLILMRQRGEAEEPASDRKAS